jgi:hypothetical protein
MIFAEQITDKTTEGCLANVVSATARLGVGFIDVRWLCPDNIDTAVKDNSPNLGVVASFESIQQPDLLHPNQGLPRRWGVQPISFIGWKQDVRHNRSSNFQCGKLPGRKRCVGLFNDELNDVGQFRDDAQSRAYIEIAPGIERD